VRTALLPRQYREKRYCKGLDRTALRPNCRAAHDIHDITVLVSTTRQRCAAINLTVMLGVTACHTWRGTIKITTNPSLTSFDTPTARAGSKAGTYSPTTAEKHDSAL